MKDDRKTKQRLIDELMELRSQNAALEKPESAEKYRGLVENIKDVIYELDSQGVVLYISPAVRDMLGFDSTEIIGKNFTELAYKDDLSRLEEWFSGLRKGQEFPSEYRVSDKSGQLRWAQTRVRPIMENNQFRGARGILIDITEQKRVEEALRESEELFRSYLEYAPDAVYMSDAKGNFLYGNRKCEAIIGYKREELIGKNFLELNILPEKSLNKAAQLLQANIEGKSTGPDEIELISKEGRLIPVEISTSVVQRAGEGIVLAFVRDITDRKRSDEKLRASEERFRTAAENLTDVVYDWDIKEKIDWHGDIDGVMGYPPGGFPRTIKAWAATIHPEDKDRVMAALEDHVKGVAPFVIEYRVVRKDGESRWWSARGTALRDDRGEPYKMIGSITDITERKQSEDALRKSEEEFRLLAESMPQIVWVTRKDGWNIYFNQQWVDYTGLTLEESYGHGWNIPFHPDDQQRALSAWENATKNNDIYSLECRLRRADGVYHWWLVRGVPLLDETGEIIKWFGTCTDIDDIKNAEKRLQDTLDSLRRAVGTTIQVMVSAVEARDPYTSGHQLRSTDLARAIATEMGLPQEKIEGLRMAGSIHDIGKLSIPAELLSKPTKLTNIEFSLIKEHARMGYEMLKDVESPWPLAQIVYQHHERMDGSGYPRNLKGDEILLEARIMAVADVVEAMASHRPYRPSLGLDKALEEIEKNRGIFYDNAVADACLRLFRDKRYQLQ